MKSAQDFSGNGKAFKGITYGATDDFERRAVENPTTILDSIQPFFTFSASITNNYLIPTTDWIVV
ncbi:MAG: hypothetical protein CMI18_09040 [Opitutaceae bacterium]|nr:hypothetical protein [Opitutaceae bacterium]